VGESAGTNHPTGSIAEAYYNGVPQEIVAQVRERVPGELWNVEERFSQDYFQADNVQVEQGSSELRGKHTYIWR
jgi:hypothetical protein